MSRKDINYVGQLFKCDGEPKLWEELKNEFDLQGQLHFIHNQMIHSIPKSWKDALMANSENMKTLVFQGHHFYITSILSYSSKSSNLFSDKID